MSQPFVTGAELLSARREIASLREALETERRIVEQHAARHGWVGDGPNRTLAHPALHLADMAAVLQRELEQERHESAVWRGVARDKGESGRRAADERDAERARADEAIRIRAVVEANRDAINETRMELLRERGALLVQSYELRTRAEKAEAALRECEQLTLPASKAAPVSNVLDVPGAMEAHCHSLQLDVESARAALAITRTATVDAETQLQAATEALTKTTEERDSLRASMQKISDIRDSIVGMQGFNFSEHAYPLVAVLDAAGFEGKGYEIARENLGTLIEQTKAAEKGRDAALKACAEKDHALSIVEAALTVTREWRERGHIHHAVTHALSPDAGKGYASPDEQRALAEMVREACRDYVRSECGKSHAEAIDALDITALLGKEGR